MVWNLNWWEFYIIWSFLTFPFLPYLRGRGQGKGLEESLGSGSPYSNQPCLLFDGANQGKHLREPEPLHQQLSVLWFRKQFFLIGPWSSLRVARAANSMLPTQFYELSWSTYNIWQYPEITHLDAAKVSPYITLLFCKEKHYFWLKSLFHLYQVKGSSFFPLFNFPLSRIFNFVSF